MKLEERFKQFDDVYGKFEQIVNKRATRPDLHAFMLLDELLPGSDGTRMLSSLTSFGRA